jgi:hypothetical protein
MREGSVGFVDILNDVFDWGRQRILNSLIFLSFYVLP